MFLELWWEYSVFKVEKYNYQSKNCILHCQETFGLFNIWIIS